MVNQNKKRLKVEAITGPITARVKSWEDVCKIKNIDPKFALPYPNHKTKQQRSINAVFKISTLSEVLNEGVTMDFTNLNQSKYYCWWHKNASGWVLYCVSYFSYGSSMGSGFYFATRELANYASSQFKDWWIDYLPE